MNLVALTPCCVDFYPQRQQSFLGGNSLNVASMWKKLNHKSQVSVITALGNDLNGKMIINYLIKIGVDISRVYLQEGSTACNQLRVDENGERFGIEGTWNGGVYENFKLSNDDWSFIAKQDIVAMPANNPNFSEMLKRKHKKQLLSVDYLDVENNIPIEETIEYTDIAFITGRIGDVKKYQELAYTRNKLLIVTLGAGGSYAFYKGALQYQSALPVSNIVDTTGCGDAYQAAFALKYFQTNNIKESMVAGALAASQILQAWGGVGNV
jgi:fructoselysine 6-kinase